jgi:hypothetical protein
MVEIMNDKELLEFAAKAAGYKDAIWQEGEWLQIRHGLPFALWAEELHHKFGCGYWNPLFVSSETFSLAAQLRLNIEYDDDYVTAWNPDLQTDFCHMIAINNDAESATRRAIVSKAAEIGKKL